MTSSAPKKILVVDDEKDFLEAIDFMLSSEGYQVTLSRSGHEMLEKLKEFLPDLILLDNMMPTCTGIETLTYIRGNPDRRNLPVILMSASKEPKVEGANWNAFIRKPFDIESLLQLIRQQLRL